MKNCWRNLTWKKGIDIIMNSHYHEDHTSFNYLFPEAKLYVPRDDAPCFRSLETLLDFYGLPETKMKDTWRNLLVNHFNFRERIPDLEFKDGDLLNFGDTTVEVVHTTRPHDRTLKFLLSRWGGALSGRPGFDRIWSMVWWQGLRHWPDHRFPSQIIDDPRENIHYFSRGWYNWGRHYGTGREISRNNQSVEKTLCWIFLRNQDHWMKSSINGLSTGNRGNRRIFFEFGERGMIKKHLDRLTKNGIVSIENDRYYLL